MSLAGVLSGLKEIILDMPPLPAELAEREDFIRKHFPALSPEEASDLAKIAPEKFLVYSTSVFSAERNLIRRNFPFTIAYLQAGWPGIFGCELNLLDLTKTLHKFRPWQSSKAVQLGENFVAYIEEVLAGKFSTHPFLPEIARMELSLRIVRRAPDDKLMAADSIQPKELRGYTIESLMELDVVIPSYAIFLQFGYELIDARAAFITNKKQLPSEIKKGNSFTILSRNAALGPAWTFCNSDIFAFLAAKDRSKPFPLSQVGEIAANGHDKDSSEEIILRDFLNFLYSAIENGALIITKKQ